MNKIFLWVLLFIVGKMNQSFAADYNWQIESPFNEGVWIKNNGEFKELLPELNDSVLFYSRNEGVISYITPTTLSYLYIEQIINEKKYKRWVREETKERHKEKSESDEDEEKEGIVKYISHHFRWQWANANSNCSVDAGEYCPQYVINYNAIQNTFTKSNTYKNITLKSVYPGIDIEYIINAKGKIKYNIIVHPGGDITQAKLIHSGLDKPQLNAFGEITYQSPLGLFIHGAPYSYHPHSNRKVTSSYKLHNNTLSFQVGSYDKNKTIVIDPWVSNPGFPNQNEVYDVATDSIGNVWAYGSNLFRVLKKYDTNGNLQWTLSTNTLGFTGGTTGFGDIDVDKQGNCYMSENGVLYKWDTQGNKVYGPVYSAAGSQGESFFRVRLNYDEKYFFGLGAANVGNIYKYISYNGQRSQNCINTNFNTPEFRAATTAPSGKVYTVSTNYYSSIPSAKMAIFNPDGNYIKDIPVKGFFPYYTGNGGATYINNTWFYMHNGIGANCTQVCVFDGDTLAKYDSAGVFMNYTTVNQAVQGGGLAFDTVKSSGLLMDGCNNTFLGTIWGINKYDAGLNYVSTTPTTGAVFDMDWLATGDIAAGGENFIGVFPFVGSCSNITYCPPPIDTAVTLTYTVVPSGCQSNSGKILFDVNSVLPYYYIITGNDSATINYYHTTSGSVSNYSDSILNLAAGIYLLEVGVSSSASYFCLPKTYIYNIVVPQTGTLSASVIQAAGLCGGSCAGVLTGSVSLGSAPFQYNWSTGATTQSTSNICAGTYSLLITDNSGCTISTITTLTTSPSMSVTVSSTSAVNCGPACVDFYSDVNPLGSYSYQWSYGDGAINTLPTNTTSYCYLLSGVYTPSLTVTDGNNCSIVVALNNTIEIKDNPKSLFYINPSSTSIVNPSVQVFDQSVGADSIFWNFNDPNDVNSFLVNIINPSHAYSDTGKYCIQQIVISSNGCVDSSQACVIITPDFSFYVPNTFTPNGDGLNDFFNVTGVGITEYQLWIYDRWGDEIYSTGKTASPAAATPWNGKANGGSKLAQEDVYVWKCMISDISGKKYSYVGHLVLIR